MPAEAGTRRTTAPVHPFSINPVTGSIRSAIYGGYSGPALLYLVYEGIMDRLDDLVPRVANDALTLVCAWCGLLIQDFETDMKSHGICLGCKAKLCGESDIAA